MLDGGIACNYKAVSSAFEPSLGGGCGAQLFSITQDYTWHSSFCLKLVAAG